MITLTWSKLKEFSPSSTAIAWGKKKYRNKKSKNSLKVINDLIADQKLDWANCLISHLMTRPQYLAYKIYMAEQIINLYEKKYPNDDRPRKAIEAAKRVVKENTEENRKIAYKAANVAYSAASMTHSIFETTYEAAFMASVAASSASPSSETMYSAASAAAYAAVSTIYKAAYAAASMVEKKEMLIKILDYGIELMKKEKAE